MSTKWLCKECYNKFHEQEGIAREIKLLPNVTGATCEICNKTVADYLTCGFNKEIKYTCALCKGIFDKTTPEDEALAELKEFFGEVSVDECDIVCDDCWEEIRPDKFGLALPVLEKDMEILKN